MCSGRPHRGDGRTSSGRTSLDVLEPTCSFEPGHHSCRLPTSFVVLKNDRWFLDYSLSSCHIPYAIIMKCADEYDIPSVFPLHDHLFLVECCHCFPLFQSGPLHEIWELLSIGPHSSNNICFSGTQGVNKFWTDVPAVQVKTVAFIK